MLAVVTELPEEMNRLQRIALLVGIAGLIAGVIGFFVNRTQFYNAWLFAWFFWLGVALGSMAITMLHHLTGGDWGIAVRRTCEAAALTLPLLLVLFIPVLTGMSALFPWANASMVRGDHVLEFQHQHWTNPTFFTIRALVYFAIWIGLTMLICSLSIKFDQTDDYSFVRRIRKASAIGLIVYMFTMSLASIDWVISREPHFYSTVIGFMITVGQTLSGMVLAVALLPIETKIEVMDNFLTPPRRNDLGNLILTLVILWAYVSFAQLLVVWMGNIKPETPWYVDRGLGQIPNGWRWVGLAVALLHFFMPFFILLSRDAKRHLRILAGLALALLILRALDVYWLVAPSPGGRPAHMSAGHISHVSWMDLPLLLGIGGVWFVLFVGILRRRPLLPHPEDLLDEEEEEVTNHEQPRAHGIG
jgi:hypothetical protein